MFSKINMYNNFGSWNRKKIKDFGSKTREIQINSRVLHQCLLCKMLTLGGAGEKYPGPLNYLYKFIVNLKLFQNETFI